MSPRKASTLRSGTTQRVKGRLKSYTISSTTSPFPPTATPLRHFMHLKTQTTKWLRRGWESLTPSCTRVFVRVLPDEYDHIKATLQAIKNRDRAEIILMVGTRYSTLPQKKGSQRLSRPPEQAVFSSESGSRRGARQGCGRSRRGT